MSFRSIPAALQNDLRAAERDWQDFARFDVDPKGNPAAAYRDEAKARYFAIKAEIAALNAPVRGAA